MTIQVLVATMHQTDHALLEKMNIQTDVIVCNQCDYNDVELFSYCGHDVRWLSFAERGVGLNRNNALMRADANIAMFADDDMVYVNGYDTIVKKAFDELPDADVIIFDLTYPRGGRRPISQISRLTKKDCMRFGAARLAVRLSSIKLHGISFNLCFGGGTAFSSGEDTLFLNECLTKKLKIYSYPAVIARLQDERQSTWFRGYNDKYFFDKGVLYYLLNRQWCGLLSAYHCFKHRARYREFGRRKALMQMKRGIHAAKANRNDISC